MTSGRNLLLVFPICGREREREREVRRERGREERDG